MTVEGSISTRRDFLAKSAASATAIATGLMTKPACAKSSDEFGGLKVGVQSYCYHRFDVLTAIKEISGLGLNYIELYPGHSPIDASADEFKQLQSMLADHDLNPISIGVLAFGNDHDANRKNFEHAARLGVKAISADPTPDSFESVNRLVLEYKIPIAIHPHGPVGNDQLHLWHRAEIILHFVKDLDPMVGTCLDTGHLIRCAQEPFNTYLDPAQQIRAMGNRNHGIHLKDNDNKAGKNVVVGRGALNVAEVLTALREVDFQGGLSIEHEAHPEEPTPDLIECVQVVKETIARMDG